MRSGFDVEPLRLVIEHEQVVDVLFVHQLLLGREDLYGPATRVAIREHVPDVIPGQLLLVRGVDADVEGSPEFCLAFAHLLNRGTHCDVPETKLGSVLVHGCQQCFP